MKKIKEKWNRLFQPKNPPAPTPVKPKFSYDDILWDEYVTNEDTIQTLRTQLSILNRKNSDIHEHRQDILLRGQALERFIIEKLDCNGVELKYISTGFNKFGKPQYKYEVKLIDK